MQAITAPEMRRQANDILTHHLSPRSPLNLLHEQLAKPSASELSRNWSVLTRPRCETLSVNPQGALVENARINENGKLEWIERGDGDSSAKEQRINSWAYYFSKKSELWQLYRVVSETPDSQYGAIADAFERLNRLHAKMCQPALENMPLLQADVSAAEPLLHFALRTGLPLAHVATLGKFSSLLLPLGGELAVRKSGAEIEVLLFQDGRFCDKVGEFQFSTNSFTSGQEAFGAISDGRLPSQVISMNYLPDCAFRYFVSSADFHISLFEKEVRLPEGGIMRQVENFFGLFGMDFKSFWPVNSKALSGGKDSSPFCSFSICSTHEDRENPLASVHFNFDGRFASEVEFQGRRMFALTPDGKKYAFSSGQYLLAY